MFIQIHNPKSTGEIISLERRLYEVVQKEWDNQEPTGHSFAQQTQKDVSSQSFLITNLISLTSSVKKENVSITAEEKSRQLKQ